MKTKVIWFATKKQIQKSFNKIKKHITELTSQSLNNRVLIEKKADRQEVSELRNKVNELRGAVSVLVAQSQKYQSQKVSVSPNKSQDKIETKVMNRIKRRKKAVVMAEIEKLSPSHSTIEMYEIIVLEKGLCSKASFYRYIASLKSQSQPKIETKERLTNA